jgi:hypothetical protein
MEGESLSEHGQDPVARNLTASGAGVSSARTLLVSY